MLKVTQEMLNLGLIRRIMLSVLVWAIGVVYHVECRAWKIYAGSYEVNSNDVFVTVSDNDGLCGSWGDDFSHAIHMRTLSDVMYVRLGLIDIDDRPGISSDGSINGNFTLCLTDSEHSALLTFYNENPASGQQSIARINCAGIIDSGFTGSFEITSSASGSPGFTGHALPVLELGVTDSVNYGHFQILTNRADLYTAKCRFVKSTRLDDLSTPNINEREMGVYISCDKISSYKPCIKMCEPGYYCPMIESQLSSFAFATGVAPVGRFSCGLGQYCASSGLTSGTPCEQGYYQDKAGQTSCNTCPSVSQYDTSGSPLGSITGTTSTTGAKSDTECFINANGNLVAGGNGVFAFTGACYYS